MINLIILGPQGSGKGTQAKLLAKQYDLEYIGTGDLLRDLASEKNKEGKEINEAINKKGKLIPYKFILKLVKDKVKNISLDRGIIFDGTPRRLEEAKELEKILRNFGRSIKKVIYLNIPSEETVERLSKRRTCEKCNNPLILGIDVQNDKDKCPLCGGNIYQRKDDTPDKIKIRLDAYHEKTLPIVDYFKKKDILIEIDGHGSIEEVFERILSKVRCKNTR